jgi:type III restriction enzyme
LRFIFSHSALREGWDNPNVFQICTLNETKSDLKKRQEIGRGLRLCVNRAGERIYDKGINRLTVIANESYEDFANALQKEIETDCGVAFGGRIKNKRERKKVNYRKGFELDPKFLEIWDKIKYKTKYSVSYKTDDLINRAGKSVKEMPNVSRPSIRSTRMSVNITDDGVSGDLLRESQAVYGEDMQNPLPDVVSYIQSKTELTRQTVFDIIRNSGRIKDILVNPQMFMDYAVASVKKTLYELMIDGIKYEKIGGKIYEMTLFDDADLEIYLDNFTHNVRYPDKTIYDNYIHLDSSVESQFAMDCETREDVEFYFKLPNWFKIPTPIGNYNPDWAVVFNGDKKVYFVAETKSKGQELRPSEDQKIRCGQAHFDKFEGVVFAKKVSSVSGLLMG